MLFRIFTEIMARLNMVYGSILLPLKGCWEFYDGLNGWFLDRRIVVIMGMMPRISVFWITNSTCSPILALFS